MSRTNELNPNAMIWPFLPPRGGSTGTIDIGQGDFGHVHPQMSSDGDRVFHAIMASILELAHPLAEAFGPPGLPCALLPMRFGASGGE